MKIHEAVRGKSVVIETDETVYIGRIGRRSEDEVELLDCAVHPIRHGEDTEAFVRSTAKFGIAVDEHDVIFPVGKVRRVRWLGEIPKER